MRSFLINPAWCAVISLLASPAFPVSAQNTMPQGSSGRILRAIPAPESAAGGWHRLLFGSLWRDAWTTEAGIEELDLAHDCGGLTMVSRSGDSVSFTIGLRSKDGESYLFRTLRRTPVDVFSHDVLSAFAPNILKDLVAGTYPYAEVMADVLRGAVGMPVRHSRVVAIGTGTHNMGLPLWCSGRAGILMQLPAIGDTTLRDTHTVMALAASSLDERIDAREVLKIRLLDFFMGSWCDRSAGWQWRAFADNGIRTWKPVDFDSPLAFCAFNGAARIASGFIIASMPGCTAEYPAVGDLAWDGRQCDRSVLSSLSMSHFDSLAAFISHRLTDSVIAVAIERIPRERRDKDGPLLLGILQRRRDGLPDLARQYYAMLAHTVDINATQSSVRADVKCNDAGGVSVGLYARSDDGGGDSAHPAFFRSFDPNETVEVRLHMNGGSDVVHADESADVSQVVRIITNGRDSGNRPPAIPLLPGLVPDDEGPLPEDGVIVRKPKIVEDRGSSLDLGIMLDYNSEFGPLVGFGPVYYRYGFGFSPYAWTFSAIGGFAPFGGNGRLRLSLDTRSLLPGTVLRMNALVSGYDMSGFFGVGNEVETETGRSREYYYPHLRQYRLMGSWSLPVSSTLQFSITGSANYVHAQGRRDRYVNLVRPYGVDGLAFFGIGGMVQYDSRDEPVNPQGGVLARISAMRYPATNGLSGPFNKSQCDLRAFVGGSGTPALTLATRILVERTWGDVPYFERANLGGWYGLRGLTTGRYLGDALALGTVELRASVCELNFIVPMTLGAGCFGETGRVFVEGETSRRWHASYGGSIWVAPWTRDNTLSFILAGSKEGMEVYFDVGVGF